MRREILSGELAGATPLRQEELAARFGTSRIPAREALRQLEVEGLVTIEQNKTALVSVLSPAEVLELQDIRIALECRALRLAVPNMAVEDFDRAAAVLRRAEKKSKPQDLGELNWMFHEALYAPCNRPRLMAMIESNYSHIGRFARAPVSEAVGRDRPQREHWAILEACRAGNADVAVKLLEQHIGETQKSLQSLLRRTRRPGP